MIEVRPIQPPATPRTGPPGDEAQMRAAAMDLEASFLAEMLTCAGLGKSSDMFGGGISSSAGSSGVAERNLNRITVGVALVWTMTIIGLGLVAFTFDTVGGVLFGKIINLFTKKKVNPMIGAAGISAFPMASRVIHKMGLAEDKQNFLLMHAAGANVAGQIASVLAGGMLLNLIVK